MRPAILPLAVALALAVAAPARGQVAPAPPPDRQASARVAGGGGPIDPSAFRYSRAVAAGEPGLAAIRLDAAVLAHARRVTRRAGGAADIRFADIRLVGPNGQQVPYLVECLDESLVVPLPPLERATPEWARDVRPASGTLTYYRLSLPYPNLPSPRLVLNTPARVFTRTLWLERDPPGGGRRPRRAARLAGLTWASADPDTAAAPAILAFDASAGPGSEGRETWLVVNEGDNSPLPLEAPVLLLPACRLRFARATGAPLTLVYGNPDVEPPRYDLALLAPALLDAPAAEAAVGPERVAADRLEPARIVFWALLVGAVVALLALVARLVRTV